VALSDQDRYDQTDLMKTDICIKLHLHVDSPRGEASAKVIFSDAAEQKSHRTESGIVSRAEEGKEEWLANVGGI
jgi:hypothetical protein